MARRLLLVALLLVTAVALALAPAAGARPTPRVVGGAVAAPLEAPWAAAIVATDVDALPGQICGGTVISPRAVVTAAHCLDDITERFEVVVGRERLSSREGERIPVAEIRVNPSFRDYEPRNDVAVVLLSRPTRAPVLPLAGGADAGLTAADQTVRVYGWGAKKRNGRPSDDLKVGGMRVLSAAACSRRYPDVSSDTGQLCATGPADGLPGACSGDSGGPLVAGQGPGARVVGIVSYGGERCGDPKRPTVFTRVADFAPWIARQAGIAPPPGPARPPGLSKVVLRFSRFSCPSTCRVGVRAIGEGAESLTAVDVRIRAGGADRVFSARRLGERKWRVDVGDLPPGRVRVTATGLDDSGRSVGERAKTTLAAVG